MKKVVVRAGREELTSFYGLSADAEKARRNAYECDPECRVTITDVPERSRLVARTIAGPRLMVHVDLGCGYIGYLVRVRGRCREYLVHVYHNGTLVVNTRQDIGGRLAIGYQNALRVARLIIAEKEKEEK